MTATGRHVVALVVLALVVSAVPAPAAAAAAGTTNASASPSSVSTGAEVDLSLSIDVTDVNTTDATTGATATLSVPDAVDLSAASVGSASVGPNASVTTESVDPAAGTVTVEWDDDSGVDSETLTVAVVLSDVVVGRTGTHTITADVDADATGDAEVAGAAVGSVTATATGSDRSVTGERGVVYLGEEDVDVTGLAGASPAGDSQQFYGAAGDARGGFADAADSLAVDVTADAGFVAGGYNLTGSDGDVGLSVRRPAVSDFAVYSGRGTGGADVTNGSVPAGTTTLSVAASYNFAEAENLSLTVVDDDGVDVTEQLTADPNVTESGGYVTLDSADMDAGTYTVVAEGADDLSNVAESVTVAVRAEEKVVSLSRTRVVRGDTTIASLAGAPGDVRYLRLERSDLGEGVALDGETARATFDDTEQVQFVDVDTDAGYVYAAVSLDDDGISDVRLRTDRLAEGSVDVELAPSVTGEAEDEVPLRVEERTVDVTDAPRRLTTGETVTVAGRAPQSETVKLYAAVDGSYVPLYADAAAGTLAEADVEADGAWETDVDAAETLDLVGAYRLVAVADPEGRLGTTESLDAETLRTLEPRGGVGVRVVDATLSATVSRTRIASTGDDEVTLSGTVVGQGRSLRLYHVGPRGTVTAQTLDVENGNFTETVEGFDPAGPHDLFVVAPGRDGEYAYADGSGPAVGGLVSGSETRTQAIEILRDAYGGAGVDDRLVHLPVLAERPTLSIDTSAEPLAPGTVTVSGTSNREDGTTVVVEALEPDGSAVAVATAPVGNGTWAATLELREMSGSLRLVADDGESTASRTVRVDGETATGTGAASQASQASHSESSPSSPTAEPTERATPTAESTGRARTADDRNTQTDAPGFGVLAALVGVLLAAARLRDTV